MKASFTITVKVKAGAKTSSFQKKADALEFICSVQAPPVDGKANAEVIKLVAEHFHVKRAQVEILRGDSSNLKVIKIEKEEQLQEKS